MKLSREMHIKDIAESLTLLSMQVKILNSVNLYDINIESEDFFADLLNLIYGYELKNANILEKNAPAIDLYDEKNRISIQVTSENSSTKIKHTIREFIDNKYYEKYDRLIILILTEKKSYKTHFDLEGKFEFKIKEDVWDIKDIIKYIRSKNPLEMKGIYDFLDIELCKKVYSKKETQASEIDTIIDLIEYISSRKQIKKKIEVEVDPEYKIYNRFKNFANRLISEYTMLYTVYGESIDIVYEIIGIDEAQDIISVLFLQDISMKFLDETKDNPIEALNKLVGYFDDKLSVNCRKYDRAAIKFYLISEMIKCNVFPNERNEYNVSK